MSARIAQLRAAITEALADAPGDVLAQATAILDAIEHDLVQPDREIRIQSTIEAHICSLQYILSEAGHNDLALKLDKIDFKAPLN
jgi:hypothetical protein